jgi:DNA polymerase
MNRQWQRQVTYGGSLVENQTQAVARDLMAEAALRCEQSGKWKPVLTVHDELIAEGVPGLDIHEFEQLMAHTPPWAEGLPVDAEGWSGFRYRK